MDIALSVTGVSKELDMSDSTVRHYSNLLEKEGYEIKRNKRNHRIYHTNDVELFRFIKWLKDKRGYEGDELIRVALENMGNNLKKYENRELDVTKRQPKNVDEIKIKEYKGQRVVTFKDIDEVHGRVEGTASRNFRANKEKFIEYEDYYFVKPSDIQSDEIRRSEINNKGSYLITESGYLMLVKSFTDDLAWKVQRELVKNYFRVKEVVSQKASYEIEDPIARAKRWIEEQEEKLLLEQRIAEYEPKVTYYDKILQSKDCLTVTQIAKDYGLTAQKLNQILKEQGIQYKLSKQWLLYKEYADKGYTKTSTTTYTKHDGTIGTSMLTKWTQKGRLFIHEILTGLGYDPDDLGDSE